MRIRKILFVGILGLCITVIANAQTNKEKVYKDITVSGNTVSKWFDFEDLSEYDNKGNLVYYERGNSKVWREYDKFGNETLFKNNNGEIIKTEYEYDKYGNMIYKNRIDDVPKDSFTEWNEYDSKGRKIYVKTLAEGKISETKYDYDQPGIVHSKSEKYETWNEYDSHGNLFHYRSRFSEWWKTFKYNAQGVLIYYKDGNYEQWYDEKGNAIHQKYVSGSENWTEYEYDDNGHIICSYYYTKGLKLWNYYEYTFFPDGKIKLVKKYEAKEWN